MKTLSTRVWFCISILVSAQVMAASVSQNPIFPRPMQVPLPENVAGVARATLPLVSWKTMPNPSGEFWSNLVDPSGWADAQPGGRGGGRGGRGGRGGAGQGDSEFTAAYKTKVSLPADWSGKRVVLRFESSGGDVTVWVNGKEMRQHWGSSMPWSCDITDQLKPGEDAWITLGVNGRNEGLGAFVRGGGVQGVSLIAFPQNYISRLHVETKFDQQYKDATLQVWLTMSGNSGAGKVKLSLKDDQDKEVALNPSMVELLSNASDMIFDVSVSNPKKWDAEHPNLYTLQASVVDDSGNVVQTVAKKMGFREIEVRANQVFVNGKEVKLRGLWGGNNIAAMKQLNVNHTRQKWVTEQFLNEADRQGIYVLDESQVDFAKFGAEADPKYAYQWLNMMADLVERDRDHPSVIMWGLANESFTGENTLKAFKYVQAEDKQRPIMSSWANRVPVDQELPYSVYSSHYPNLNDPNLNLGGYTVAKWHSVSLPEQRNPRPVIPVLHDEYGHIILNQDLLKRDPESRNFWGESIYRYWEKMFVTQGALGGDLFEFGRMYGGAYANGNFADAQPEAWLVKKAYSPVRVIDAPLPNPGAGKALSIPIKNWFDHTNLSEIKVEWTVGDEKGSLSGLDVAPHSNGTLVIPARAWRDGEKLGLKFISGGGLVIDEYLLPINPTLPSLPKAQGPAPKMEQTQGEIVITGEKFRIVVSKYKGMITGASYDGKPVIAEGPFIDLLGSGLSYAEWWCDKVSSRMEGNEAVIDLAGNYAVFRASFQLRIDGQGLITTKYTIDHVPGDPPPSTYSPWDSTSVGGYAEVGVSYMLPARASEISWKRKGLWSVYPENHIGRTEGTAQLNTDDGRSTKENIYQASVKVGDGFVTALSDGHDSVRVFADNNAGRSMLNGIRMGIHSEWNYPDIGLGNYAKPPTIVKDGYTNTVYLKLGPGASDR